MTVEKIDTTFQHSIHMLRNSILNRDYNQYVNNAYYLYTKLIKPIKERFYGNRLIIIPDGLLGSFPFDVLLTAKPDSGLFQNRVWPG